MEIYANHYIPMKPVSTLLQNSVRNGDIVTANILNTKNKVMNKSLPVTKTTKKGVSLKKR
jgi:hypothetical protein